MQVKDDSVNIWGLDIKMQPVLKHAHALWEEHIGVEMVITSARDGIHSPGSLHYYGFAVDIRTWDKQGNQINDEARFNLATVLQDALHLYSKFYEVFPHKTHIHIEYDS